MFVRFIADAVMSRLLLAILILMIAGVAGVLLVKRSGGEAGNGRVERSLSAP